MTRIAECFASSPDKLDELCNHGLVTQAASLISTSSSGGGQISLSPSTYTVNSFSDFKVSDTLIGWDCDLQDMQGLVRLLSTCVSGSPLGAKTLLLLGCSGILKDILSGSGLVANLSVSPSLNRPPEQVLILFYFAILYIYLTHHLLYSLRCVVDYSPVL